MNRFRRGSLVMKLPDSEAAKIPTLLFGTINGSIGVVASLPQQQFAFLSRLQVRALWTPRAYLNRLSMRGLGLHADWQLGQTRQACSPTYDLQLYIQKSMECHSHGLVLSAHCMWKGVLLHLAGLPAGSRVLSWPPVHINAKEARLWVCQQLM